MERRAGKGKDGDRRVMEEPMEKYLAKKYRIPQKKQRNIYNKELEEWI